MNRSIESYTPKARQEDLVIEGLGDETLIYDMRTHKAHCLNRTAALVWNRCDGRATVSDVARALGKELHRPIDSEVVWLALEQLSRAELLSDRLPKSALPQSLTRRAIIKKIGLGAAIALPLVTSILAPTAEANVTCVGAFQACTSVPCCTGLTCQGGICG